MIFITNYKFKSHMTDEELSQLLTAFMEHGEPGETIGHYQAADRSCGVVISEVEDLAEVYATLQHYQQWMDFDNKAMLPIESVVPLQMAYLGISAE